MSCLGGAFGLARPGMSAPASSEQKHDSAEGNHHQAPPQIDVDGERTLVELTITQCSKEHKHDSAD